MKICEDIYDVSTKGCIKVLNFKRKTIFSNVFSEISGF